MPLSHNITDRMQQVTMVVIGKRLTRSTMRMMATTMMAVTTLATTAAMRMSFPIVTMTMTIRKRENKVERKGEDNQSRQV